MFCYSGHHLGRSSLGLSIENPALNCKDLKNKTPSVVSGVYWIDPDGGYHGNAFEAYCDQQTDGGGWTLVWSYTFTDYSSFTSSKNAVTPRPTWTFSGGNITLEFLQQFHSARPTMKPWTLLCGAPLVTSSLSKVTSTTGSLARRALAV